MIHMGFSNYLAKERVVAITTPGSAPAKRYLQEARARDLVIDLTMGRRTKSLIFTDCQYLVLVSLEPSTVSGRLDTG